MDSEALAGCPAGVWGSRGRGFKSRRPDAAQRADPQRGSALSAFWGPPNGLPEARWPSLTAGQVLRPPQLAGRGPVALSLRHTPGTTRLDLRTRNRAAPARDRLWRASAAASHTGSGTLRGTDRARLSGGVGLAVSAVDHLTRDHGHRQPDSARSRRSSPAPADAG